MFRPLSPPKKKIPATRPTANGSATTNTRVSSRISQARQRQCLSVRVRNVKMGTERARNSEFSTTGLREFGQIPILMRTTIFRRSLAPSTRKRPNFFGRRIIRFPVVYCPRIRAEVQIRANQILKF